MKKNFTIIFPGKQNALTIRHVCQRQATKHTHTHTHLSNSLILFAYLIRHKYIYHRTSTCTNSHMKIFVCILTSKSKGIEESKASRILRRKWHGMPGKKGWICVIYYLIKKNTYLHILICQANKMKNTILLVYFFFGGGYLFVAAALCTFFCRLLLCQVCVTNNLRLIEI